MKVDDFREGFKVLTLVTKPEAKKELKYIFTYMLGTKCCHPQSRRHGDEAQPYYCKPQIQKNVCEVQVCTAIVKLILPTPNQLDQKSKP